MESMEKKPEVKKSLERIHEKSFSSFEMAAFMQGQICLNEPFVDGGRNVVKKKIFARHDGTFDLVLYASPEEKRTEAKPAEQKPEEPKEHGLTAKQRRAKEKRK